MKVLWLQSGGCGGCTQSLLCAEPRPLFDELHDAGIEFLWHPGLSLESGEEALAILEDCAEGRLAFDALCVEGAMLRGPNGSGRFHLLAGSGRPLTEWVERLARRPLGVRHRFVHGLRRVLGQHAGQSARSLRPAIR